MALVLQDRVRETSSSTGTGDISLGGAYVGYRTFSSCVPDNSVVYYCIQNTTAGYDTEWEVGYGLYDLDTNTLKRNTGSALTSGVYSSSNADTWVSFSSPATLNVFITQPAEQAVYQEVDGSLKLIGGIIEVSLDGTESVTPLPNVAFQAFSTINSYMQTNMQNLSTEAQASADYVVTANDGTDTENYIDLGMGGNGYNYPEYSAAGAYDGYLMNTGTNLVLISGKYGANAAAANASATDIVFVAGDLLTSGTRGYIKGDTGNFILGPYGTADNGQKLQVTGDGAFTANVSVGGTVTVGTNPSSALQVATKQYVDQQTSTGIHIHTPCTSETSAALSAVYTQGGTTFNITDITGTNTVVTSTTHGLSVNDEIWLYTSAGNGLSINTPYFVYDTPTTTSLQLSTSYGGALLTGLTNASGLSYATRANSGVGAYLEASANQALPIADVMVGDRVLVYNQPTGYWNGVYTVTSLGAADPGGSKWKLTRATDANQYQPDNTTGMGAGDYFFIQSNSEAYVLTNPTGAIIIGYDAITYTLFSSVPAYTVNSPLQLVGTTLSLTTVPATLGGTGANTVTTGDILYGSGTDVWSKRSIGNTGAPLIVSGGYPTWGTIDLSSANAVTSTLGATNGGTGQSTYVLGDLLYSSATNTLAKLAGQTTTTKKYLQQQGTGTVSAAPSWQQIAAADISGLAPSATTDTSNATNITSGTLPSGRLTGSYTGVTGVGTLTAGTWNANAITASYGGTGVTTLTGIAYGNGTSAFTAASAAQVVAVIGSTAVANATYAVSANSSTYTSNLIGGLAGGIPYQTGVNATTILAAGTGVLVGGATPSYSTTPTLTGTNFSGIPNSATTATAANTVSAIVARDISGNFAAGTITANLTGTASSATTAVNVAAANLTGTTLSSNVTASSLTGLGTVGTGTWQANTIAASYGGTGVAGSLTGISYMNGTSAHTAASAAQVVAVIGSTAVANATYAVSAGSATTAGTVTTAAQANITSVGTLTSITTSGAIKRSAAGAGYLSGEYSGVETTATSGAIYSIGTAYPPGTTTLGTMYGIGYTYSGGAAGNPGGVPSSKWGMYVASGGIAKIWLDSDAGNGYYAGSVFANSDERLKTNWRPVQDDFVAKLAKVKSGIYDRTDIDATQAGVSAQDMQKILEPSVTVGGDEQGLLTLAYGNAALVAAVELAKEVVKLRAELEALKTGA